MTVKLWRPDATQWGNRWPAEEALNRLLAEGRRIVAVLPADPWSGEVPTVLLRHRRRWHDPPRGTTWQRVRLFCWYYIGRRLGMR